MTTHTGGGSTAGQLASETGTLAPWASNYVGEMLGRGQALSSQPYTAYTGPISAGQSQLQGQAFGGLGALQTPTATAAGSFTAPGMAQQYTNPYMESALQPQMDEARRQSQIEQQLLQSRYGKAGAYGGGRQAVAEAEMSGALQRNLADIYGRGMEKAYDKGADLFSNDRTYGLDALQTQLDAGTVQRDIQQEGIAAQISQFTDERDDPYKKLQYQQSLLQGLPIDQIQRDYIPQSDLAKWLGYAGTIADVGKGFKDLFP